MEQEQEVQTVLVNYRCDVCKRGDMLPTGMCLTSSPPQYPHKCVKCGNVENFLKTYPYKRLKYKDAQ